MEQIARNVGDLGKEERKVYETALGQPLREDQQVILSVVTPREPVGVSKDANASPLPDWCNVYEGLSDSEISDLETVVLDRTGWTRDVR